MPRPMIRLRSPSPSEAAPRSGASAPIMRSSSSLACTRLGSGWPPPKSGSGVPLRTVPAGAPSSRLEDRLGIRAGDGVHRVEGQAEAAGEQGAQRVEVEQLAHQRGVVGHRVDHLDRHRAELLRADAAEVDVGRVERCRIRRSAQCLRVDRVGDLLRRRAAVGGVELDAEVAVRAAGVVAGRQDQAAEGAVLADHARGRRGRQDAVAGRPAPARSRWPRPCG